MHEWCGGVLWGAAQQGKLTCSLRRPPVPPTPMPSCHRKSAPADSTVSGGNGARWGSLPHPLLWAGQHVPASAGAQNFWASFFWRPVRPGSAHGQPDRLTRPNFIHGGMGGMGEGGRVKRKVRGGHGRGSMGGYSTGMSLCQHCTPVSPSLLPSSLGVGQPCKYKGPAMAEAVGGSNQQGVAESSRRRQHGNASKMTAFDF